METTLLTPDAFGSSDDPLSNAERSRSERCIWASGLADWPEMVIAFHTGKAD